MKFGADIMMPMNNEFFDVAPTRGNLTFNGAVHRQCLRRFPARLRAARAAHQRVRRQPAALVARRSSCQDDWKVSDALTVNARRALRLHHAALRSGQQDGELRSGRRPASSVFASDGSLEDRALVKPDKNNFSPRVGLCLQARRADHPARRLRRVLQPVRARRVGGSARAQPAGAAQYRHQRGGDGDQPRPLHARRVPGKLPRPARDRQPDAPVVRHRTPRARSCSSSAAGSSGSSAPTSWSSADVIGSVTDHLAVIRNLNQPLAGTLDANGPRPYPAFGSNVQWREMTGDASYKGVDLGVREALHQRLQLSRVVHDRQQPRQRAGAPGRQRRRPSAGRPRPGVVGRSQQLRYPPPLRRQLHRGAAVRRGQADAAGRRGRQGARRLARQRHLQRAHRPAVHGDPGQQQRRRRRHRRAGPHRRSRGCEDGRAVVQHRRLHARCRPANSATAGETSCADPAG